LQPARRRRPLSRTLTGAVIGGFGGLGASALLGTTPDVNTSDKAKDVQDQIVANQHGRANPLSSLAVDSAKEGLRSFAHPYAYAYSVLKSWLTGQPNEDKLLRPGTAPGIFDAVSYLGLPLGLRSGYKAYKNSPELKAYKQLPGDRIAAQTGLESAQKALEPADTNYSIHNKYTEGLKAQAEAAAAAHKKVLDEIAGHGSKTETLGLAMTESKKTLDLVTARMNDVKQKIADELAKAKHKQNPKRIQALEEQIGPLGSLKKELDKATVANEAATNAYNMHGKNSPFNRSATDPNHPNALESAKTRSQQEHQLASGQLERLGKTNAEAKANYEAAQARAKAISDGTAVIRVKGKGGATVEVPMADITGTYAPGSVRSKAFARGAVGAAKGAVYPIAISTIGNVAVRKYLEATHQVMLSDGSIVPEAVAAKMVSQGAQ
jgi:hypothetical protein